jgi:hypothetical protein
MLYVIPRIDSEFEKNKEKANAIIIEIFELDVCDYQKILKVCKKNNLKNYSFLSSSTYYKIKDFNNDSIMLESLSEYPPYEYSDIQITKDNIQDYFEIYKDFMKLKDCSLFHKLYNRLKIKQSSSIDF